jgi:hypothetical protein
MCTQDTRQSQCGNYGTVCLPLQTAGVTRLFLPWSTTEVVSDRCGDEARWMDVGTRSPPCSG